MLVQTIRNINRCLYKIYLFLCYVNVSDLGDVLYLSSPKRIPTLCHVGGPCPWCCNSATFLVAYTPSTSILTTLVPCLTPSNTRRLKQHILLNFLHPRPLSHLLFFASHPPFTFAFAFTFTSLFFLYEYKPLTPLPVPDLGRDEER